MSRKNRFSSDNEESKSFFSDVEDSEILAPKAPLEEVVEIASLPDPEPSEVTAAPSVTEPAQTKVVRKKRPGQFSKIDDKGI